MSLDGLGLMPLIRELDVKLAGARVDKIYQTDKYTLVFWLRQVQENVRLLISVNPEHPRIHILDVSPENPAAPPAFCMLLRKHCEDARVAAVKQHGLDRVAFIDMDIRGEHGMLVTKTLVIEMMGKHSNIILVQDNTVIDSIKRIGVATSRIRQILPGREYQNPPGQTGFNLLETPPAEFVKSLQENTGIVAKVFLKNSIGLGPITIREILWRAGLPEEMPVESLDYADTASLSESLDTVLRPLTENIIQPTVIFDENNRLKGIAPFTLEHLAKFNKKQFDTMSAAVQFVEGLRGIKSTPAKELITKMALNELTRLEKKKTMIVQEWEEANSADNLRKYADILMANLHCIPAHANTVTLPDLYSEKPDSESISIELDPLKTPLENANNYYHRYNKLKRARELLSVQVQQCRRDINYIDSIVVALELAVTAADVNEIRDEFAAAGYMKETTKRRTAVPASEPIIVAHPDGYTLVIGKNNKQNDQVTFKYAKADDIWFHTKDSPGSHVILRTNNRDMPNEAIETAAHLAAYFSKGRQSANVPVDYTKRRYVKKPSGAKPGFVIYEFQNTIYVTPDEQFVKPLLK